MDPYCTLPFPLLGLQRLCQASPSVAFLFSVAVFIDTFYVLQHRALGYGGGT